MQTQFNAIKKMGVAAVLVGATFFGTTAAHASSWLWPTTSKTISMYYGASGVSGVVHTGLDIDGETGDPVYASHGGIVLRVLTSSSGYGNAVYIKHGTKGHWIEVYAHLDSTSVNVGDHVKKGDVIGTVGSTGFSTGDHLHFEVRHKGETVNPLQYLVR